MPLKGTEGGRLGQREELCYKAILAEVSENHIENLETWITFQSWGIGRGWDLYSHIDLSTDVGQL